MAKLPVNFNDLTEQQKDCVLIAHHLNHWLMRRPSPGHRNAALGGIIANTIGPIPEDDWQEMMKDSSTPCVIAGCGCAALKVRVMEVLDELRTDWIAERRKAQFPSLYKGQKV
jgi:hypothetical protein